MSLRPKTGEHPLATTKRGLHQELAGLYGLIWLTSVVLLLVLLKGHPWALLLAIPGTAAGGLATLHWRWSR